MYPFQYPCEVVSSSHYRYYRYYYHLYDIGKKHKEQKAHILCKLRFLANFSHCPM